MSVDIDYTKLNGLRQNVTEHYHNFDLEKISAKEFEAWVRIFTNLVISYQQERFTVQAAEKLKEAMTEKEKEDKRVKP